MGSMPFLHRAINKIYGLRCYIIHELYLLENIGRSTCALRVKRYATASVNNISRHVLYINTFPRRK